MGEYIGSITGIISLGILIVIVFMALLSIDITPTETLKEESCDHEVCEECGHLIKKGTGQEVVEDLPFGHRIPSINKHIYCHLHRRPYDRFSSTRDGIQFHTPPIYYKKVYPWKRVNEDGSDWVEDKPKHSYGYNT